MNQPADKQYIYNFLKQNKLALLSTVSPEGDVHTTPIYFVADQNFDIYFISPENTNKAKNIKFKSEVLLTIVNEGKEEIVQIKGRGIEEKSLLPKIFERFKVELASQVSKGLPLFKYKDQEKTVFLIKPSRINFVRFSDNILKEQYLKFD